MKSLNIMLHIFHSKVYMPLLAYNQHRNGNAEPQKSQASRAVSRQDTASSGGKEESEKKTEVVESKSKALLRDEFLINMQKFASAISRTLQQIEGEVSLVFCCYQFDPCSITNIFR